jgi:hypothetical protein
VSEPGDGIPCTSSGPTTNCVSRFHLLANDRPPSDQVGLHQQGRGAAINGASMLLVTEPRRAMDVMCFVHFPRNGRHFLPRNEWGFAQCSFGHRPAQRPCDVTPQSVSTPPVAPLRRCGPLAAGHFGLGCVRIAIRVSGFCHPALVWRDGRTLDDPGGRRPVPAPALAYAGSGRLQW